MPMAGWIHRLRSTEIVDAVYNDPRSTRRAPFGIQENRIFSEVLEGGQADFDAPWNGLSADDRAILYALFNQKGHLEELSAAFTLLFARSAILSPVVVDLGCGPFTGGLALAGVLGNQAQFTYIGQDRAFAMHRLGERLALAAIREGGMQDIERHWVSTLDLVCWARPTQWRPVVVIVSYLFMSATVDPCALVAELERLLLRVGRGAVTVLYTNSPKRLPNRHFSVFQRALEGIGFALITDDLGEIEIERWDGPKARQLRYALLQRQAQATLKL
jgi:hypothetical protein